MVRAWRTFVPRITFAEVCRPDRARTKPYPRDDSDKQARWGESTKETVKTIACGNAGCSGGPVVTTLVCYLHHCTRGCGCSGHPAFPTPSVGRKVHARLGRIASRDRGAVFGFDVIARSKATKQSTLSCLRSGLLRGACHRARIRATRWLAMT